MDDEPIVISSGSLYSPESVAAKSFATGFRGYDQSEVRNYLKRVADELSAAATREAELRDALLEAHKQAAHPDLDEETLTAALGEHAAHLLTKAREAAASIVAEAEKRAARIMGEAEVRITRVRSEADGLLARRSEEADRMTSGVRQAAEAAARTLRDRARAEAEAEVESARKQGREMVGEARAVRERMLADLTRRRRTAEVQIEHLRMARVRLLEAYSVVRRTLDEATHELSSAEADAGPVLDAAAGRIPRDRDHDNDRDGRRGADDAGRSSSSARRSGTASGRSGDHQPRPAVSAPSAQELAGPAGRQRPDPGGATSTGPRSSVGQPVPKVESSRGPEVAEAPNVDPPKVEAPNVEAPRMGARRAKASKGKGAKTPKGEGPSVDAPKAEAVKAGLPAAGVEATAPPAATSADELFARLRAAQAPPAPASGGSSPATPSPPAESAPPASPDPSSSHGGNGAAAAAAPKPEEPADAPSVREESALAWRDKVLEPLEADLVRRLKRILQDEQNEVLDRLRQERRPTPDSVLPSLDEQLECYRAAAAPLLARAADRGSEFALSPGAGTDSEHAPAESRRGTWNAEAWATALANDLAVPLRERLAGVIGAAVADSTDSETDAYDVSGVTEGLSANYRQWKADRIVAAARHHTGAAFSEGAFFATPEGAERRWVVDDDGGPCPDCDDNTLAGSVTKGQPFPTGQTHPPAHDGCRCILAVPR